MLFQNAVFQRDGKEGFAEVFRRPPVSTQQILHPEKYFANEKPSQPELPDPQTAARLQGPGRRHAGRTGAWHPAGAVRPGRNGGSNWRRTGEGCTFELQENKKDERVVLLYAVEWDSEESARQYFTAYREILRKKWKQMTVTSESAAS